MKAVEKMWEYLENHMYVTTFWMTVIVDFWANWYSYAIVHDWIILQAFLGFAKMHNILSWVSWVI